ncbi:geranylgeranylglyceryl/heptaprenylglyceryl phosphate synthase [Flavobacterium crassostreae]|uniref:Geranylgeranylglyceryl phosphate synthase n=1 Tax=Flavobacterium crassostreae TaxID=1763534 RepID=A0A1B9E4U3_9FLAO|nr:geranylgeranylglyceryl/heptaprenylglyceryl phosphate synthase [Flavobacterium crassostreae]OCB76878.1 geranylgeranylglyceryl/heptaprenylglyceryl phosphate synthase [Flavobacterium crassostreae]
MQNKNKIYQEILKAKANKQQLLAILLDPDKISWQQLDSLCVKINQSPATHIFIGGSLVVCDRMDELIISLKQKVRLPIVLFPGDPSQISDKADAILFLSLLSGRNPDYLIAHQVQAAPVLKKTSLEIIPTAYILISGGKKTAVERVSKTAPLDPENTAVVTATALAGEMMGNQLVYLEAGSGAALAVPQQCIASVAQQLTAAPLIVGGGIVSAQGIADAYKAGADMVVIGTAFEKDMHFFDHLNNQ